jgi:hypothetical protein
MKHQFSHSKIASKAVLVIALGFTAATSAQADTVNLSNFTFLPAVSISVSTPNYSGQAGQFSGHLNGNSFVTYCTELTQSFYFNTTYNDYSVVDGATAWGATRSQALNHLMSAANFYAVPTDAAQSAAVQAAVWEVLYETSGTYDLNAGTFKATSANLTTQGYLSALNASTWANLPNVPITHKVDQLYSPGQQNFMVITSVPEPESYAMLLAGLGLIGTIARRRSQQKVD